MKETKKMKIESNIPERDLIESCLNLFHSGYNYMIYLSFHALAKGWHIDKLLYYIKVIENDNS